MLLGWGHIAFHEAYQSIGDQLRFSFYLGHTLPVTKRYLQGDMEIAEFQNGMCRQCQLAREHEREVIPDSMSILPKEIYSSFLCLSARFSSALFRAITCDGKRIHVEVSCAQDVAEQQFRTRLPWEMFDQIGRVLCRIKM